MKRRGITLIEVLVAIFIMALGMLALLTLFPLGALRMAQAIQDDRAAQCAANAGSIANMKNIRNDPTVVGTPDVFRADLDGDGAGPDPNGPGNPILVDPAGARMTAGLGGSEFWVAGAIGLLPRRTTSFDTSPTATYRWFTFLDDYDFDRNTGIPAFPATREYLYSWTYLLQRPKASDPSVVNASVLVFKRRPLSLTSTMNLREFYLPGASFDTSSNVVTINHGGPDFAPPLRAGDWIMDASPVLVGGKTRNIHANFHRVVSVIDTSDTTMEVEVQTPFRGPPGGYTGTVIIFEGLVEVFDRGAGWK